MKKISLKQFIAHFGEDLRAEKRFCFILGAGASKTSGIPTGWEMVEQWVKEMRAADESDVNDWLKANSIKEDDLASHYSQIFDKRFELSKKDGFAFLEKQMDNIEPSCGYSVLAQILANGKHNVVITTNFDSLTEDALFIYTQKKPLVVGHASLAEYISTNLSRPLVVKVHHDLFLSPKNSVEEVGKMDNNYSKNLKDIFKFYTPLVIGYGGNDGSLMNFLEELDHVEEGIFWFYMEGSQPKENIIKLVEKVNGCFVAIKGFDELMIQLGDKLGLEPLDTKIKTIADKRIDSYRKQIEGITGQKAVDKETKEAVNSITSRGKKTWWNYELQVQNEKDVDKKNQIYLRGIKDFPNSYELLGSYALFLSAIKKDYKEAEKYYLKALEMKSNDSINNGNYASFLSDIKKDYKEAEKYYLKALEMEPNYGNNNGNYANFLSNIKKDYKEAEKYYLTALKMEPKGININTNYALFLSDIKKDYIAAENYFLKALKIGSNDANINGAYAIFLKEVKKDYKAAEKHYLKALEIEPNRADINGAYAVFLYDIKKEYETAEKHYLKALKIDPNHAKINVAYAFFLSDIKKDYKAAEKHYLKALEIEPNDANSSGNYAKLLIITGKKEDALQFINKAFELNNNKREDLSIELWFYCYAIFPKLFPESKQKIEALLDEGIQSIGWDLSEILKIAKADNHPDYEQLVQFDKRITQP